MKFDAWGTDNIKKDIVAGNIDVGFMWTGDFLYYYCEKATETTLNAYINKDANIDELINVLTEITKDDGKYQKGNNTYSIGFDLFIPNDTIAFCDNLVISNQSSNPELAHKFIDFMISNSVTVNGEEYTPAYSNTYYVDYNTPYLSVYNKIINLKYSNPEKEELITLTNDDEDLFNDEIKSNSISDTTLYSIIYDYATSIAFGKYYDKDVVKGNILASFPRTYINSINTTFNNARA